MYLDILV